MMQLKMGHQNKKRSKNVRRFIHRKQQLQPFMFHQSLSTNHEGGNINNIDLTQEEEEEQQQEEEEEETSRPFKVQRTKAGTK